jgi:hypothetical protein
VSLIKNLLILCFSACLIMVCPDHCANRGILFPAVRRAEKENLALNPAGLNRFSPP